MALLTLGTAATTTLRALQITGSIGAGSTGAHDVASWNALAQSQNAAARLPPTIFNLNGQLHLSGGRGVINCLPGDFIAIDPTSGWPILVTARAITGGGFIHS